MKYHEHFQVNMISAVFVGSRSWRLLLLYIIFFYLVREILFLSGESQEVWKLNDACDHHKEMAESCVLQAFWEGHEVPYLNLTISNSQKRHLHILNMFVARHRTMDLDLVPYYSWQSSVVLKSSIASNNIVKGLVDMAKA